MNTNSTELNDLLRQNYQTFLASNGRVSSCTVAMLSAVKAESFDKAVTHFGNAESLLNALTRLKSTTETMLLLARVKQTVGHSPRSKTLVRNISLDKEAKQAVGIFLGDKSEDLVLLRELNQMLEQRLLVMLSNFV